MIKNIEIIKKEIESVVNIYKSGDINKAEVLCNKLLKEHPKSGFLHNFLGLILASKKKYNEAIESYEKCIEIEPNFALAYNNLGLLYFNLKSDSKSAEKLYRKAININSKLPEPYNNLGMLYNSKGKYKEAIENYKKSISINSNFIAPYHNIANVYISIGDFKKAKENLTKSINLDPNYSTSHRSLSRLTKYKNSDDEHLKLMTKLFDKLSDVETEHKSNFGFALGKANEDIKSFDKSFFYYNEANKIYRKKIDFSIKKEGNKFNEIKSIFNKNLYNKYKNSGYAESSPIFIVGMPRSGTTLVEQILSSHPKIHGCDEIEYIPLLINKYFGNHNLNLFFSQVLDFKIDVFEDIGKEYIAMIKKFNTSKISTDKLPLNFLNIGLIKLILPNSKIIHCNRNPRDNCLSIFKNHFPGDKIAFAYDINEIVEYYNLYYNLMNYWNNLLPNFIFNINYENLISNTNEEISKLLNFCSLNWSDECLNFYNNERPIKTASDIQVRSKIYDTSIESWKNFEKNIGKNLEKLVK